MNTIIPPNRKWTQTNESDTFGSLYSTYNVHFDEAGYLKISPKAVSIFNTVNDSTFGTPLSIFYFGTTYFIVTIGKCFTLGSNLTMTALSSAPDTTINSDGIQWQSRTYVTVDANLSYYDGSWTNSLKTLTANRPHPLEVMGNFSGGHLAIGDANTVLRLDTSHSTVVTLTLNANYQVETLKYVANNLYIGTRSLNGKEAKMFVWNGSGTSAQSEYSVGANWLFSLEEFASSVACITSEGQLLRFNGGGFDVLANLPVYSSQYRWTALEQRVHRRGLRADGDLLYLHIDGRVSRTDDTHYLPNQPSGIWCYDPKVGLYCRHLSTTDNLGIKTATAMADSTLTISTAYRATTGEPVFFTAIGSLTGISANMTYYIIAIPASRTFKLALTPADAKAGIAITLGGTIGVTTLKIMSYNDFGNRYNVDQDVGAIGLVHIDAATPRIFPEITRTPIMWGIKIAENAYLNVLTTGKNVGAFTTNKVWSSQIKDSFQKAFIKYDQLNLEGEQIIVKSRSRDVYGLPTNAVSGTFASTSSITSTSGLLAQTLQDQNLNLLSGNGAGQSAKLSSIAGTTYTLSEELDNVAISDTTYFNVDNFEHRTAITENDRVAQVTLGDSDTWQQLMVELRGQNIRVEEIQLAHATQQPTK